MPQFNLDPQLLRMTPRDVVAAAQTLFVATDTPP